MTGSSAGRANAQAGPGRDGAALKALAALFACHSGDLAALDPATRARCEAGRLAQVRGALPVDGVPVAKRAYFDAVVAAQDAARDFRPVGPTFDPRENRGPSGVRSRGLDAAVSYACEIKFGQGAGRANGRAGVRLGIPPCPPHLPLNPTTAEMRVPPPDTLRDREEEAHRAARFDPPPSPNP